MVQDARDCVRCGGVVAGFRTSTHPSGVTVEYGICLACGAVLRRLLPDERDPRPGGAAGTWVPLLAQADATPPPSPRRTARAVTGPPGRVEAGRPRR